MDARRPDGNCPPRRGKLKPVPFVALGPALGKLSSFGVFFIRRLFCKAMPRRITSAYCAYNSVPILWPELLFWPPSPNGRIGKKLVFHIANRYPFFVGPQFPGGSNMKVFICFALIVFGVTTLSAQDEQAPIIEREINYKDWTYKNVDGGGKVNLRDFAAGKKLVLVVYWAPWCHNWPSDIEFVKSLQEKYKDSGFAVIGVGLYDSISKMRAHLEAHRFNFPMVFETDTANREKTLHYEYRKASGDKRRWGTPFYVFLQPDKFETRGDLIMRNASVVNGELIDAEVEIYVRKSLGLPEADSKP